MVFSSLMFLCVFLPVILPAYYLAGRRGRNAVLLLFSLAFYGWGEPKYLLVMLASILLNYAGGRGVDRFRPEPAKARLLLVFVVFANLAILAYFKYANFFIESVNTALGTTWPVLAVALPIGISFFTFQGLSYVVDIYRGRGKVQTNPLNVALYISLFPQLIAGPIVRYATVAEQITERQESLDKFAAGVERFILGLGKKVLIANSMGRVAGEVFGGTIADLATATAWIGVLAYTAQIYFDFSGYSDMAIGLGRLFGFEFLENFDYPYISRSITEFWRRWHISLGTWFRDYVYIPLGGNRGGTARHLRNLFVVWLLTGTWHGAAWNFVVWGLYFGCLLALEKYVTGRVIERLGRPLQHLYTLLLVVTGWVLFRADTLAEAMNYLSIMAGFRGSGLVSPQSIYYLVEYRWEFLLAAAASTPVFRTLHSRIENMGAAAVRAGLLDYGKPVLYGGIFLLSLMYLVNSTFNPFIYFRF